MAFISERCFTGSILVMASPQPHISQKVNPARLVIPHQRKNSFGEKKILHTKGFGSITVRATSAALEQEDVLEVAKKEERRFLRLVYRVTDLERSIKYYTECFRMKLYQRKDDENSSRAILGFGPQMKHFVVEIFSTDLLGEFDIGTGFGHFGISAHDVFSYVDHIKANGGTITLEPNDTGVTYSGFAMDPDGYLFELVQRPSIFDLRLSHVNFRVADLNRSILFYEQALGMKKLDESNETEGPVKFSLAIMGYAHDYYTRPSLELSHLPDQTEYTKGNAYSHFAIGTNDVDNCAKAVSLATQKLGVNTTTAPPPALNIPTSEDPDGWKIVFFDNEEIPKEVVDANQ